MNTVKMGYQKYEFCESALMSQGCCKQASYTFSMEAFCFLVVGCSSVKALVVLSDLCWAMMSPNLTTVCMWCYWNVLYGGQWWTAIAPLIEVGELYLWPYRDIGTPLCWLVLWLCCYLTLLTNLSILETVGTDANRPTEMSFWMSKKSLPQYGINTTWLPRDRNFMSFCASLPAQNILCFSGCFPSVFMHLLAVPLIFFFFFFPLCVV